jgi:uncharacterized repeat protein (TIGR01451 family)
VTLTTPKGTETSDLSLAITSHSSQPNYVPGSTGTSAGTINVFKFTVTNNGPNTATNMYMTDTVPSGWSWTCSATSGSSCPASGFGNMTSATTTSTLLSGGTLTFSVYGALAGTQYANLSNTPWARVATGSIDPNTANNTATDTLTRPSAITGLVKVGTCTIGSGSYNDYNINWTQYSIPGLGTLTYKVELANGNSSNAVTITTTAATMVGTTSVKKQEAFSVYYLYAYNGSTRILASQSQASVIPGSGDAACDN